MGELYSRIKQLMADNPELIDSDGYPFKGIGTREKLAYAVYLDNQKDFWQHPQEFAAIDTTSGEYVFGKNFDDARNKYEKKNLPKETNHVLELDEDGCIKNMLDGQILEYLEFCSKQLVKE